MKKPKKTIKKYTEEQRLGWGISNVLMEIQEFIDDDPTNLKSPEEIVNYIDKQIEKVEDWIPVKCDTEEGYCCACDYDIACMEYEIRKAKNKK